MTFFDPEIVFVVNSPGLDEQEIHIMFIHQNNYLIRYYKQAFKAAKKLIKLVEIYVLPTRNLYTTYNWQTRRLNITNV